jgi:hypothetical protein
MELLKDTQAASRIGISVRTLRKWRLAGKGPRIVKLAGWAVRYRLDDLDAFVTSHEPKATKQ